MQSGRLRNRVELQRQTVTRNEFKEEIVTWAKVADLWADIRPSSMRERMLNSADQLQAAIDHTIVIRWRSDISAKQRIKFGSRIFDIEGYADRTGKRHELQLSCREVLP
jgi:SPP1 family predicted phage head-tail adaptor